MRELGLAADWLRPSDARELEPRLSSACAGAIHAAHEAAVDPRRLVVSLRTAALDAGVELLEGAEVIEGLYEGEAIVGVRTQDGAEHVAPHTVLAAGAWSGAADWVPEQARPAVRPIKGQILTLRGQSPWTVCGRIVASERVYMVPREDGRLIVGATVEEQGFDLDVTAGGVLELLREAYRALPDISELELVETVAGLRPGTPDNLPVVGAGAIPGLVLATGHFRNGMLLAPTTAAVVSSLLAGESPDATPALKEART
jgi:glycine oxidase